MPVDLHHPVRATLDAVLDAARPDTSGEVASYIPELANVEPERLGIALVSTRGDVHDAGDSDVAFTIQSVSKPFVFALALDALGVDEVTKHVGLEPSGEPFNAISLQAGTGRPANPMINAGAILTTGGPLSVFTMGRLSGSYLMVANSAALVTDVGLALLHPCKNLAFLNVEHTGVTVEGVASLRMVLPKCEVVWGKDTGKGN